MTDEREKEGPATPDFAACAAGLSAAMKKIAGGFTTMGDEHFQEIAEEALKRWGYFPPKQPPDWLTRQREMHIGFQETLAKVMTLIDYGEETRALQARAIAAENRVQELLRVVAGYEKAQAKDKARA